MAFGASSGADLSGYAAPILATLGEYSLKVLSWQSMTIRDRAILSILIEIHPDHTATLDEDLQSLANRLGIDIASEYQAFTPNSSESEAGTWSARVVIAASQISSAFTHSVMEALKSAEAKVLSIGSPSRQAPALEFKVSLQAANQAQLQEAIATLKGPVALLPDTDPNQKLYLFDMDSTLINEEVIDVLAAHAGKGDEVTAVTESAMRGEIDFAQSLTSRVAHLEHLPITAITDLQESLTLTPGVIELFEAIHRSGHLIGVVSGGFHNVIDPILKGLGVDFILANTLEDLDNALTGKVIGPIIDAQAKAKFLSAIANEHNIDLAHTVAIGDGANDREMITMAGLGVAFCAKPALVDVADVVIQERNLALLIPLTGL